MASRFEGEAILRDGSEDVAEDSVENIYKATEVSRYLEEGKVRGEGPLFPCLHGVDGGHV